MKLITNSFTTSKNDTFVGAVKASDCLTMKDLCDQNQVPNRSIVNLCDPFLECVESAWVARWLQDDSTMHPKFCGYRLKAGLRRAAQHGSLGLPGARY